MDADSDRSSTGNSDEKNEDGWEDVEPDVDDRTFKSLFDDEWFDDITRMLKYDKENHGFDYVRLKDQYHLDFLECVQLINYVRSEVREGRPLPKVWSASLFRDEQYLKPTLEDDAVLYSLDDVDESALAGIGSVLDDGQQEVRELREALVQLQSQFAAYREQVHISFQDQLDETKDGATGQPSGDPCHSIQAEISQTGIKTSQEDQESGYFDSYSSNAIHESMLKDTIRTDAYRDFVYDNKDLFAGKTVLDVGCGTGILSLFCAKAGAKKVFAVDNSGIIDKARVTVYDNGFQDVIRCLRGKIEEVNLPVDKVDIIISEWMGYGLLYESMLDSVLWARDRYLEREHGLMVPSHATLRVAALVDSDLRISHIDFWRSVYGFDMSSMLEGAHDEALVRTVPTADVSATSVPFLEIDLHVATPAHLTFLHPFEIEWTGSPAQPFDGWLVWFDIFFSRSNTGRKPPAAVTKDHHTALSTGPGAPETHWQQVALLAKTQDLSYRAGDVIRGKIGYQKREGRDRSVDIEVIWEGGGDEQQNSERKRQVWTLD